MVEAQACGTPVIAYGAGGALETVKDIREHPKTGTGLFFPVQESAALIKAVETFEASQKAFDPENARLNATQFAPKKFEEHYLAFIERCYQKFWSVNLNS
ncbi:MAG: hypothetical protein NVS2B14_04420 [Chamaesiphon sp.]